MKTLTLINIAALVGVMASAIAVVVVRQEHRQRFVELTNLENERDALRIDYGRLQLEQATWADPSRIEQLARGPLGMKFPEAAELRVVNR